MIQPYKMLQLWCAIILFAMATGATNSVMAQASSVSGYIQSAIGGNAGVTLNLIGPHTLTTLSTTGGSYQFTGVTNGTYVLTPSKIGYNFTPTQSTLNIIANLINQNFTLSAKVGGTISGATTAGVTLTLNGAGGTFTTTSNLDGSYAFIYDIPNGIYTLTASHPYFTFFPATRTITANNDVGQTHPFISGVSISGVVQGAGPGMVEVEIIGNGFVGAATTGTGGAFTLTGVPPGNNYTVFAKGFHTFLPTSRIVNVSTSNLSGMDFTIIQSGFGANKVGGTANTESNSIARDAAGNLYITGNFSGTAVFGSTILESAGGSDIFVAKLTPHGMWEWAIRAGGGSEDYSNAIAVDGSGNIYCTGSFGGTATFGSTALTSVGNGDIFIAKLNGSGVWQWAVSAGSASSYTDNSHGIAVDGSGNIYCTGFYVATATFGVITLTSSGSSRDIFIAKLNSSGVWEWAVHAGGTDDDYGNGIAVDGSGDVYCTGFFRGTATFGGTTLTSSGWQEIFIAKLNSSGVWQWAVRAGGTYTDYGTGIAVDGSGNVYITGIFHETASFGGTSLTSAVGQDIYIAKLNSSGVWEWAVRAGGTNYDYGTGIAVDGSGNIYCTGSFGGTATFGSTALISNGSSDIFIGKLNSSGVWQWAVRAGSTNYDVGNSITFDGSGNVYCTGSLRDTATLAGTTLFGTSNNNSAFVWKLSAIPTYAVSGNISGSSTSGVTLTLVGNGMTTTATSMGSGEFLFPAVTNGTYTLTPSGTDLFFAPSSYTVNVSNANVVGRNFIATPTYSVNGSIAGVIQSGVTLILSGNGTTSSLQSGMDGSFTFTGVTSGSYTLTPSLLGYTFSPSSQSVTVANASIIGQNFTSSLMTYTISGSIAGVIQSGVTLTLTGNGTTSSLQSGVDGSFSFTGVTSGSYTLTPSLSGYVFSSSSQSVTIANASITGQNFISSLATYTVSGNITGATQSGVTLTLAGNGTTSSLQSSVDGSFIFTGVTAGTYTLSVSSAGYTFSPASLTFMLSSNLTSQNFSANISASVSGYIQSAIGGNVGVTLDLTGTHTLTTLSTTGGYYQFTGVTNGTYVLTPSKIGYNFTPTQSTLNIIANLTNQNFTLSAKVGGTISGATTAGVTLTLNGAGGTFTTTSNLDGSYAFIYDIPNGAYTLSVSHPYFTFATTSAQVTVSSTASVVQNFSAGVTVSGTLNGASAGIAEVEIINSSFVQTVVVGAGGSYTFTGVPPGTYTVIPKGFHTFVPTSRTSIVGTTNITGTDYVVVQSILGANKVGGNDNQTGYAIAVHTDGSVYISGTYAGTARFGDHELTSAGNTDIFVAKLTNNGVWEWAVRGGGTAADEGTGVAVDAAGNVYVVGVFSGSANFGVINRTSNGQSDIIIAKLNNAGAWQWADAAGSNGVDRGEGIAVNTSGTAYITGSFADAISFGTSNLNTVGVQDIFVAKISTLGAWEWAQSGGSTLTDESKAIALDAAENVFITGYHSGTMTLGGTNLIGSGAADIFIAKLNSAGIWQAAVRAGGTSGEQGYGITTDATGNVYATGSFSGTATFGPTNVVSSGNEDMYVAKLDNNLAWQWVQRAGSANDERGYGITTDSEGAVYVAGMFSGTSTFGNVTLASQGSSDIVLTKYNTSGSFQWAQQAGSSSGDIAQAATFSNGNLFVTGTFGGTTDFQHSRLVATNFLDAFVWKTTSNATYSVQGAISGATDANVTLTLAANGSTIVTTASYQSGEYMLLGVTAGTYTVTPSLLGYSFTPTSQTVTVSTVNVSGIQFIAVQQQFQISGVISGVTTAGVAIQLQGNGAPVSTASTAGGAYSFSGLLVGTYTVTPSLAEYNFTPTSSQVTLVSDTVLSFQAAHNTYSLSGNITGDVLAGVTLTLSRTGMASVSTFSTITGAYSFPSVTNGTYTLSAQLAGYSFSPTSLAITIAGASSTNNNFTATLLTYSVSGQILGAVVENVTVALSGNGINTTATSNALGQYSFIVTNGNYTVTPTFLNHSFTPTQRLITVAGSAVTVEPFTSALLTFTVSGTVTGASGNVVTLQIAAGAFTATTTSDINGAYTFLAVPNGSYTLTPLLAGYTFAPASRNVVVNNSAVNSSDFTATLITHNITGSITGVLTDGVVVSLSGNGPTITTASVGGTFSFLSRPQGTYTVTPVQTGYVFTPTSQTVVISTSDQVVPAFASAYRTSVLRTAVTGDTTNTIPFTLAGNGTTSTVFTNAIGELVLTVTNGTYTLTPAIAGFTFIPSSTTVTISNSDVTVATFASVLNLYSISGTVSGEASSGVNISLTGSASRTTTTNGAGNYSFTGLRIGNYTITPSLSNHTFAPVNTTVTISNSNITGQNFTASLIRYDIAGSIAGIIQAGVPVRLFNGATLVSTATSTVGGNFTFVGVPIGVYSLVPELSGFVFSPTSQSVTVSNTPQTVGPFFSSYRTSVVSGTISGDIISGVTLTLSGNGITPMQVNSNVNGVYVFSAVTNGTYTLTPNVFGYTFTPLTTTITVQNADVNVPVLTSSFLRYTVSGVISGEATAGVTVSLTGNGHNLQTTSTVGGVYNFGGLPFGSYVIQPSLINYSFTPQNRSVTITNANITEQNFTATLLRYSVTGTISGSVQSGVTITLTNGVQNYVTTSTVGGSYVFNGIPNGTYTVIPSVAGYFFAPTTASITVQGSDVSVGTFTSIPIPMFFTISGSVSGDIVGGVSVVLTGPGISRTVISSTTGQYTFDSIPNGTYTITPVAHNFGFTPPTRTVQIQQAHSPNNNFVSFSLIPVYNVSGTIRGITAGDMVQCRLVGTTVSTTLTVSASGEFTFTRITSGTYTLTVSSANYFFIPASRVVNIGSTSATAEDFTAVRFTRQAQPWQWVARGGAGIEDQANSIAVDRSGNLYVAGAFQGVATFENIGGVTQTLTSAGNSDMFIAKYTPSGNLLWIRQEGGSGLEQANGIALDSNNNIYIAGIINGTSVFGTGGQTQTFVASGTFDAFVAKFDPNGNYIWGKQIGGNEDDYARGIAVRPEGTVAITGSYRAIATFTGGGSSSNIGSAGVEDMFVALYSTNGVLLWARNGGSTAQDEGRGVAFDSEGNILVTGNFGATATFSAPQGGLTLTAVGGLDLFVAKYTNLGNIVWARSGGSSGVDYGRSIALDQQDNIVIAGDISGSATFTGGGNTVQTSHVSLFDMVVTKYDKHGTVQWTRSAGGNGADFAYGIAIDSRGNSFVTGSFSGIASFTTASFGTLTSFGDQDIAVIQYSSTGTVNWVQQAGSTSGDEGMSIVASAQSDVWVAGYFRGVAQFGTIAPLINKTSIGGKDAFIGRISAPRHSISGAVSGMLGTDVATVVLSSENISTTVTLTSGGAFTFSGLTENVYNLSVSSPGYIFSPLVRQVALYNTSVTGQTFVVQNTPPPTYVVSGSIAGVTSGTVITITATGGMSVTTTVVGNGTFTMPRLLAGTYTVTPSASGFVFLPAQRVVTISTVDVVMQVFQAIPSTGGFTVPWQVAGFTGNNALVVWPTSATVSVNGRGAIINDAIGYFYTAANGIVTCAGYTIWQGNNTVVTVWGDDPQTLAKDGYTVGENYVARYWDAAVGVERQAIVSYASGQTNYQINGFSVIGSVSVTINDTLRIPLQTGWNMVSSYVSSASMNFANVLSGNTNVYLVKNNAGQSYLPSFGINQIGSWSIREGYQVYSNAPDTLRFIGEVFNTEPISLLNGWNMIAYLRKTPMNVGTALSGIGSSVVIVKNNAGQNYLPQFGINQIGNMLPGQGYQVFTNGVATLSYPVNTRSIAEEQTEILRTPSLIPTRLHSSAQGTAIVVLSGYDGEEIGAYTADGMLIGSGVLQNGKAALTLWGADSYSTGATEGESLSLRKVGYSGSIALEPMRIHSLVSGRTSEGLQYATGEVWFVEAEAAKQAVARVYPNPSDRYVHIESGANTLREVILRDGLGREVYRELVTTGGSSTSIDVSQWQTGSYTAELHSNVGITTLRFVVIR